MHTIQSEYYGDKQRFFIGTVINNVPPRGMEGKIQIAIKGIHSTVTTDIEHKDLPWADVLIPSTHAGASGHGLIPRLIPSTLVYGVFLDGKLSQQPLILGQIHNKELPSNLQLNSTDEIDSFYDIPDIPAALRDKLNPIRIRQNVGQDLENYKKKHTEAYATKAGYETGEIHEGLISLGVENDFTLENILGDAIVLHKGKFASSEEKDDLDISVSEEKFSLNYIGSPTDNANPSFNTTSEFKKASEWNSTASGQTTKKDYMVNAVSVGAPIHYESMLDYVKSQNDLDEDAELEKIKK